MMHTDTPSRKRPGIVSSNQPRGWLGKKWLSRLSKNDSKLATRIARGKTFARNGRVQELWFSPGLVTAEVADGELMRVSIRMRVFDRQEWTIVLDTLAEDLSRVANILEGDLDRGFVDALEDKNLSLLPSAADFDGDCDCADYMLPCIHMAAVHQLLADALDGDPFLLVTLRGWDRERLVAHLRKRWSDIARPEPRDTLEETAPPQVNWLAYPTPLSSMSFSMSQRADSHPGLMTLGPAPDQADLRNTLAPLYEAGSKAAHAVFWNDETSDPTPKTLRTPKTTQVLTPQPESAQPIPEPPVTEQTSLTERVIDALADVECAKSNDLAKQLNESTAAIRTELLELEEMGLVTRTGKTRGTRWWIG
jgi:uncharacterized Zn finger protein